MTAIVYDGKTFVADTGVNVNNFCVAEVDKVKVDLLYTWSPETPKETCRTVIIVGAAGDRSNYHHLFEAVYGFMMSDPEHRDHLKALTDEHTAIAIAVPLDEQGQPTGKRMFMINNREIFESEDRPMAVGFMETYFLMGMALGHTAEELMIPVVGRYRCVGPRYRVFDVDTLVAKYVKEKAENVEEPITVAVKLTESPEKLWDTVDFGDGTYTDLEHKAKARKPPIAPPPGRVVQEGGPLFYSQLWAWFTGLFR